MEAGVGGRGGWVGVIVVGRRRELLVCVAQVQRFEETRSGWNWKGLDICIQNAAAEKRSGNLC